MTAAVDRECAGLFDCIVDAVDAARCAVDQLGLKKQRVFLVWTSWTGGARGLGQEVVAREVELTPRPTVSAYYDMSLAPSYAGTTEFNGVRVAGISPRLNGHMLVGKGPNGEPVGDQQNFFWEIEDVQPGGAEPIRRRFAVAAPPHLDTNKFQWVVRLTKQVAGRTGALREVYGNGY